MANSGGLKAIGKYFCGYIIKLWNRMENGL